MKPGALVSFLQSEVWRNENRFPTAERWVVIGELIIPFCFCARNQWVRTTQQSLFPGHLEGALLSCRGSLECQGWSEWACVTNSLICGSTGSIGLCWGSHLPGSKLPPSQREIENDALQPVCILDSSWERGVACGQLLSAPHTHTLHCTKPPHWCFSFLGQYSH